MTEVRILSIIPPMTQLNTPYPSTAYLTGFLRSRGFKAEQADLSIALALKLLSVQGVQAIHGQVSALPSKQHTAATAFSPSISSPTALQSRRPFDFCKVVIPASLIVSLRGITCPKARALHRSSSTSTSSNTEGDALDWAFGALGLQDRAKHIATLYLNDLADVIRDAIDPRFEFVRYAESLAASQPTFDQLQHGAQCAAQSGGCIPACTDARSAVAASTDPGAHHRAFSRQRLRRLSHRADHQANPPVHRHGIGRRLLQYRAARHERAACFRLLRFRNARRRRTSAACTHRTPAGQAAARSVGAHVYTQASLRRLQRARHRFLRKRHAHLRGPAAA